MVRASSGATNTGGARLVRPGYRLRPLRVKGLGYCATLVGMTNTDAARLLDAVRAASADVEAAQGATRAMLREALRRATREAAEASNAARARRAEAINAADDAGVPRDQIAAAAGLKWPMSRQRWSQLTKP